MSRIHDFRKTDQKNLVISFPYDLRAYLTDGSGITFTDNSLAVIYVAVINVAVIYVAVIYVAVGGRG